MMLDALGELIVIFEPLDHMRLEAEVGIKRRLIDDGAHLVGGNAALFGDLADNLVEHRTDQRIIFLMLRDRKVLLGEDVGGALVFSSEAKLGRTPSQSRVPRAKISRTPTPTRSSSPAGISDMSPVAAATR